MDKKCSNCKHYYSLKQGVTGECRRFPPGASNMSASGIFPIVVSDDYCGEHEKKED